ncbi:MAG TPA: DHA2 family efflux MFS transporter permease subunit [Micropepsaceae bacterium]|nr:DHA2 family efflux MFS transporter permease subunit [Micropepsaceae bacterium]
MEAGSPEQREEQPQAIVSRIVPLVVAGAFFMDGLDSSIISTSLPQMATSFSVSPPQMSAAITSYLISLAIFIPISGWIADRFGARQVFCAAIAFFTLGSILCGLSETLPALVLSRIMQGFGGAMMTPVGRLILTRTFPKDQLMKAMGYYMLPGMIGPTMGPLVGGFITTYFTWHWNFFINVPIGLVGVVVALRYIPDIRMPRPSAFDVTGFIIVACGMGTAQFAIENLGRHTVDDRSEALLIGLALAILAGYWAYARRHAAPVLELKMFRIRTFSVAVLAGSVIRAGIATVPFLLPLLLQVGFGLNPFQSGLLTFLNTAGAMSMRAWVRHLVRRFGFRAVFVSGVFLISGLMSGFAWFEPTTPRVLIAAYLFIFGVLRSAQMIGMSALAYSDITDDNMSKATSIFALAQRLSQSLGVGISATLLALLAGTGRISLFDFKIVFIAIALLMASSAIGFRRLKPEDGWQVSGYRSAAE